MGFAERAELFVKVNERGTLKAVAVELGVSVSALSRQLTRLEREVGAPLLLRSSSGVSPTDAGARFLPLAQALMEAGHRAKAVLSAERPVEGEVVVSTSGTWGLERMAPRLLALRERAPGLRLELRLEDDTTDLIAEGVDLAVRVGIPPPDSVNYHAVRLETLPLALVASPKLLERSEVPRHPRDVAALPMLLTGRDLRARTLRLTRGEEDEIVVTEGPMICRNVLLRRRGALDGVGAASLPRFAVSDAIDDGRLIEFLGEWKIPDAIVWAIYRVEMRSDPRVRTMLDLLRKR